MTFLKPSEVPKVAAVTGGVWGAIEAYELMGKISSESMAELERFATELDTLTQVASELVESALARAYPTESINANMDMTKYAFALMGGAVLGILSIYADRRKLPERGCMGLIHSLVELIRKPMIVASPLLLTRLIDVLGHAAEYGPQTLLTLDTGGTVAVATFLGWNVWREVRSIYTGNRLRRESATEEVAIQARAAELEEQRRKNDRRHAQQRERAGRLNAIVEQKVEALMAQIDEKNRSIPRETGPPERTEVNSLPDNSRAVTLWRKP